jgi:hypothetical protein
MASNTLLRYSNYDAVGVNLELPAKNINI